MTVQEIMERTAIKETTLAIAWIKDAFHLIQSNVKEHPMTIIREKPKKKPLRAGKCSTGKVLKGNKCVPDPNYKKPAKKGFGEGILYKKMEPGDKLSALSMREVKALKKYKKK